MRTVSRRLSVVWRAEGGFAPASWLPQGQRHHPLNPSIYSSSYKKLPPPLDGSVFKSRTSHNFPLLDHFQMLSQCTEKMYLKYSEIQRRQRLFFFFKSCHIFLSRGNLIKFEKSELWFTLAFILICSNLIKKSKCFWKHPC